MSAIDVTAGAGLGALLAILVVAGARDALERSLSGAPELVELLGVLYRDLAVALISVAAVALVNLLHPVLTLVVVVVVAYVVLALGLMGALYVSVLRTWHRWDREALRPVLVDLYRRLDAGRPSSWLGPSTAKATWLMGREIFLMQFVLGVPDLTGFAYDRYLRLALADIGRQFLPMSAAGGVGVGVVVGVSWAETRLVHGQGYRWPVLAWDVCSLLFLTYTWRHLARVRRRFFIDPRRMTRAQLAAFLQQDGADLPLPPPPPPHSLAQSKIGRESSATDGDAENDIVSVDDPSWEARARDSVVMSITQVSGTPRAQYASSVGDGSLRMTNASRTDTTDVSGRRQPYLPSVEYSATAHRPSRSGSQVQQTARPVFEMSLATRGRGSISAVTSSARLSATSMVNVPKLNRLKPEPAQGRLSFQMAVRMMLLGRRARTFAQSGAWHRSQGGSDSGTSDGGDSFAEADDLVKMFGGSEAAQAMSANLPASLHWWVLSGPGALLTTAHSVMTLDAILVAILAQADPGDGVALRFAVVAAVVKLLVMAALLKEFTLVTSSGSMTRVELLPLSSKKLSEYELGLKGNGLA